MNVFMCKCKLGLKVIKNLSDSLIYKEKSFKLDFFCGFIRVLDNILLSLQGDMYGLADAGVRRLMVVS